MATTAHYSWDKPDAGDFVADFQATMDTTLDSIDSTVFGMVPKALFDANTVLAATSDNTPAALTLAASTVLARLASGGIVAATMAQLRSLLALTPQTIPTPGTTETIDMNGDTEIDVLVTLDQSTCAFTFTGWTAGKLCFINMSVVGHAARTFTFADSTIQWSGGYYPVASTTGTTNFMLASRDGGTTVYGFHSQPIHRYLWGPGNAATAVSAVSSPAFPVFGDGRFVTGILRLATAGTAQTTIVDVNISGTTAYGTQANRPTVAISGTSSGAVTLPDTLLITPGQYITYDVDQFGTSAAGLSICMTVLETI